MMLLRMKQMERLKELKSNRNEIEVQRALTTITDSCKN